MCALSRTTAAMKPLKSKILFSCSLLTKPEGYGFSRVREALTARRVSDKGAEHDKLQKSMKYNPFAYLRSEKDILKLVNTLIANTKGDGEKAGEDFWVKSERLFYCALIGYIWYEAPEEEKNFTTLLEMINASEAREDDPEFQSPVDLMFLLRLLLQSVCRYRSYHQGERRAAAALYLFRRAYLKGTGLRIYCNGA